MKTLMKNGWTPSIGGIKKHRNGRVSVTIKFQKSGEKDVVMKMEDILIGLTTLTHKCFEKPNKYFLMPTHNRIYRSIIDSLVKESAPLLFSKKIEDIAYAAASNWMPRNAAIIFGDSTGRIWTLLKWLLRVGR